MDPILKREIVAVVRHAMTEALEGADEKWLTGTQLREQFACFTPSWLKTYGHTLPRTQAVVCDKDGVEHRTGWIYPKNKIQRLVRTGEIKMLKS